MTASSVKGRRRRFVVLLLCGIVSFAESAFGFQPFVLNCLTPDVVYKSHLQNIGWEGRWFKNGEVSGTTGQSRRLEAIQIQLQGHTDGMSIEYSAHIQNIGWQGWVTNGQVAGTTGRALRLEAIKIKLTHNPLEFDILYRAHLQNIGWQGWVKNGQVAGTTGQSRRLEAIQIRIVSPDRLMWT